MNFYAQLTIATLVLSFGFAVMFYGIALVAGGDPGFLIFLRNALLVVSGFTITWGGIYFLAKQLEGN